MCFCGLAGGKVRLNRIIQASRYGLAAIVQGSARGNGAGAAIPPMVLIVGSAPESRAIASIISQIDSEIEGLAIVAVCFHGFRKIGGDRLELVGQEAAAVDLIYARETIASTRLRFPSEKLARGLKIFSMDTFAIEKRTAQRPRKPRFLVPKFRPRRSTGKAVYRSRNTAGSTVSRLRNTLARQAAARCVQGIAVAKYPPAPAPGRAPPDGGA